MPLKQAMNKIEKSVQLEEMIAFKTNPPVKVSKDWRSGEWFYTMTLADQSIWEYYQDSTKLCISPPLVRVDAV